MSSVLSELPETSAIENEIPTYRAISSRAVLSFVCGVLALLSMAHPFFYAFAVLAVVLGITADRNITHYPDILTGRKLAQLGVALGLVFGLGIATVSTVQGVIRSRNAADFAKHYADVIKTQTLADTLWLGMPPAQRKGTTTEEVMQKLQTGKKQDQAMFDMKYGGIKKLKQRLQETKDQEIHFVKIEAEGSEGLTSVAVALFEVHGPPTKDFPEQEENAAAILKGVSTDSGLEWWVDDVKYPYKPSTAALPEKPVDDGHGHAH
jgi:hypothetical protein